MNEYEIMKTKCNLYREAFEAAEQALSAVLTKSHGGVFIGLNFPEFINYRAAKKKLEGMK